MNFAIAMAVIGGISLTGGRGSIIGTVLGAMVIGVIRSGFTYIAGRIPPIDAWAGLSLQPWFSTSGGKNQRLRDSRGIPDGRCKNKRPG